MPQGGFNLSASERSARALALAAAAAPGLALAIFDPGALCLKRITCPFLLITGLPCPFCGLTRGLHHFLNGDWSGAWSLNPLAFPIALACLLLLGRTVAECITGRRARPLPAIGRPMVLLLGGVVLIHWVLRIHGVVTGKEIAPSAQAAETRPDPL